MLNFLKKLFGTYEAPKTEVKQPEVPYKLETPAVTPVVVPPMVESAPVVESKEPAKKTKKPAKPKAPKAEKAPAKAKATKPKAKKAKE